MIGKNYFGLIIFLFFVSSVQAQQLQDVTGGDKGWEWAYQARWNNPDFTYVEKTYPVKESYWKHRAYPDYKVFGDTIYNTDGRLIKVLFRKNVLDAEVLTSYMYADLINNNVYGIEREKQDIINAVRKHFKVAYQPSNAERKASVRSKLRRLEEVQLQLKLELGKISPRKFNQAKQEIARKYSSEGDYAHLSWAENERVDDIVKQLRSDYGKLTLDGAWILKKDDLTYIVQINNSQRTTFEFKYSKSSEGGVQELVRVLQKGNGAFSIQDNTSRL